MKDDFLWNITVIGNAFDIHRDTVRKKLRQAGVKPVTEKAGNPVYSLKEAAKALLMDKVEKEILEHQDPEKMLPKERKDWFQSQNEKLKYLELAGQLIPEDTYRKHLYENYSKIVSFFENLPDKMERTGLFTPNQLEMLEAENDKFRHELYLILNDVKLDEP